PRLCGFGLPAPKQLVALGVTPSPGQAMRGCASCANNGSFTGCAIEHTQVPLVLAHSPVFESVQLVIAPAVTSGLPVGSGLPSSMSPSQSLSLPSQISSANGWTVGSLSSQSAGAA